MLTTIRDSLKELEQRLGIVPGSLSGALLLALAVILALAVHQMAVLLLRPLLDERHPYLRALLRATNAPARLGLVVMALFIVLPTASFNETAHTVIERILSLTTIGLVGWMTITAAHLAADFYLIRSQHGQQDILLTRKYVTQVRVLRHVIDTLIALLTVGAALMTFDSVREYGLSLMASAGVAGLVAGLAARPMLSNLIAGIQIATTQPIRIDDEVVVEGQWGRIEEITSTYVVLGLWDLRQMIVPLSYFIEKPFENWTRDSTNLVGAVTFYLNYTAPIEPLRAKVLEIVKASPLWDGKTAKLIVNDTKEFVVDVRALVSASTSGALSDLRNEIREKAIVFLQQEYPGSLPRTAGATAMPPVAPIERKT